MFRVDDNYLHGFETPLSSGQAEHAGRPVTAVCQAIDKVDYKNHNSKQKMPAKPRQLRN
jgi:hypothetical protein